MRSVSDSVHFWRGVSGWGHTRAGKSWDTFCDCDQVLHVEGTGFGMSGRDPQEHVSSSHPSNGLRFFSWARMTMASMHAKISRVSTLYAFSIIFPAENP